MNDFQEPSTALDEIAERIQVLRKQAARDRVEAHECRRQAEILDAAADRRLSIASDYEALAKQGSNDAD